MEKDTFLDGAEEKRLRIPWSQLDSVNESIVMITCWSNSDRGDQTDTIVDHSFFGSLD